MSEGKEEKGQIWFHHVDDTYELVDREISFVYKGEIDDEVKRILGTTTYNKPGLADKH